MNIFVAEVKMGDRARKILKLALEVGADKENVASPQQQKVYVERLVDYEDSLSSHTYSPCSVRTPLCESQSHNNLVTTSYNDEICQSTSANNFSEQNVYENSILSNLSHEEIVDSTDELVKADKEVGKVPSPEENYEEEIPGSKEQIEEEKASSEEDPFYSSDDSFNDHDYHPSSTDDSSASTSNSSSQESVALGASDNEEGNLENIDTDISQEENPWQPVIPRPFDFEFTDNETINISGEIENPIDAYKLFLTDDVLDLIVRETNKYAKEKLQQQRKKRKNPEWHDTDKNEILQFFSIVITMGLVPLPTISAYWSKDEMFNNKFVSEIMPRDRFLSLLKFIHFADNSVKDKDRLRKLKPLLDKLLNNFKQVLSPGREIIIDESMIPWRGRLLFKQYIPSKSHKYGVKFYKLCTIDGYTHNLIVYAGKNDPNESKEFSHSENIVLKLLESLDSSEGRILYADNFYSSIPLVRRLYKKKIMYCGTLRKNRKGIPKSFAKKVKKFEVHIEESTPVRILQWVDKRPVYMISSDPSHEGVVIDTGKRNTKGEAIKKPKSILDYNKAKKGVDLSDQMSTYFSVLRKSLKWYRKVCFELLFGTCIVNAWIVYCKSKPKISMLEFRKQLARSLAMISNRNIEKKTPRRNIHTFIKPEGKGRKPRKKCTGCYRKLRETLSSKEADKKVRKVISYCDNCDNQPGYCLPCFNENHKV